MRLLFGACTFDRERRELSRNGAPLPSLEKTVSHLLRRRDVLLMTVAAFFIPRVTTRAKAVAASDWPAFRGPGASGVQDGFPLPTRWNADPSAGPVAGIRWKTPIPGLGHSSPIVWGNRVFTATAVREAGEAPLRLGLFGDSDGADDTGPQRWVIYCLDKKTGGVVWEKAVKTARPRAGRHVKATHANTTLATDGHPAWLRRPSLKERCSSERARIS